MSAYHSLCALSICAVGGGAWRTRSRPARQAGRVGTWGAVRSAIAVTPYPRGARACGIYVRWRWAARLRRSSGETRLEHSI